MSKAHWSRSRRALLAGTFAILVSGPVPLYACERGPDAAAFAWLLADDANPQPSGMMLVGYRDETLGHITHVTFHRVARTLPGRQPDLPAEEIGRYTVLFSDGTLGPLTYVIFTQALYYGTDLDTTGLPRRVWFDSEEDGVNGNELLVFRAAMR